MNKGEKNNISISKNKSILERWILPVLSVLAVSGFPVLFMYFQNADEAKFTEVTHPLLVFFAAGAVLFFIFLVISGNTSKSSVIASIFMIVLLNYSLLERGVRVIFPALRYWHILPIFLFILGHVAWFVCKKIQKELANTISFVICIVFCGLVLFNGITAAPTIINKISLEKQTKTEITKTALIGEENTELPNIYYLILDEYSSIAFMKKYYDYDNSAFTDYLEELGFNVSYSSKNESIMTKTIITNLVNLDYIVSNEVPNAEKNVYRKNNSLFKLLAGKGYMISGIGNVNNYGLENAATEVSESASSTIEGKRISDLLFEKTVIYPFFKISYNQAAKVIVSAFQYLKNPKNFTGKGCFTICHLKCPHEPFYFDKNGRVYTNPTTNWKEPKYYLGQYIFTTNQTIEVVESIIENDPNSIIIIQSDHSARAGSDSELYMKIFTLDDMSSIFNAVYIKGNELDIEGLSGVNTLRLLLNEAFNENFEMLEVPINNY